MSTTYDVVCDECRVTLWIGQGDQIYTGEPDVLAWLSAFLFSHHGHPLRFLSEHDAEAFYGSVWVDPDGRCKQCDLTDGHDEGGPELAVPHYSLPVRPRGEQ